MLRLILKSLTKKHLKLMLAMVIISSLGIGLAVGLGSSYSSLEKSLSEFLSSYHYPDIIITTESADIKSISCIIADSRIYKTDTRLVSDAVICDKGKYYSVRAAAVDPKGYHNCFYISMNENPDYINVSADRKFSEANNINAGDIIQVLYDGENHDICVGSIVSFSENMASVRDKYSWGENNDFGYFYFSNTLLNGTEYEGKCNQLYIYLESWAKELNQDVLTELLSRLDENGIQVQGSMLYKDSVIGKIIDANLSTMISLSVLTPLLFFFSALIVLQLFLSQIIAQNRRETGILKALGFQQQKIRGLYSLLSFLISIVACVPGIALAYWLAGYVLKIYKAYFALPKIFYSCNIPITIASIAAMIIIAQAATLISTRDLKRVLPSEAMTRVPSAEAGFDTRFIKMLPIDMKYSIVSIGRNPGRFVFLLVCLSLSLAMIIVSLSFNISKEYVLEQMCAEDTSYDVQMFFSEAPSSDSMNILTENGAYDTETMLFCSRPVSHDEFTLDIVICCMEKDSDYCSLYDTKSNLLKVPDEGIVLEEHTANKLNAAAGDIVRIGDETFVVSDIYSHSVNRFAYVSRESFDSIGSADDYSLLCRSNNPEKLIASAIRLDGYKYTSLTEMIRESNRHTFSIYSVGVVILICFAALMGFLTLFNTMQTELLEQKKELSTLRSLGFRMGRISKILIYKMFAGFIPSCLIGSLLGTAFARYGLAKMATDFREYPFISSPGLYGMAIGIVLIYLFISHLASIRKIRHWDIAENIKEKE